MTPDEAKELFSAAYDGELSPKDRKAFNAALRSDAVLARQYQQFSETLATATVTAAAADSGSEEASAVAAPTPDLLSGVQERLRTRSRGRFYADRFAERGGKGLLSPFSLALIMVVLCALAWFAMSYMQSVQIAR